jgi:hypothetical protein
MNKYANIIVHVCGAMMEYWNDEASI